MARTQTYIVGEKELAKRLATLTKQSTVNRVARPALREASGEIRKMAKRLAPVKSGQLKKSIKNVVRTSKKTGGVYAIVGPAEGFKTFINGKPNDPVNYAHLVELGTMPHLISPKGQKGSVGTLRIGQNFVSGQVYHPGFVKKPFLRPAYDMVNSKYIMSKRLWKELTKEAKKR